MLPKVNESVLILHTSNGEGKLTKRSPSNALVDKITSAYIGGDVAVGSDVFRVRPCRSKHAKWETVR